MKLVALRPFEKYRRGDVFDAPDADGALLVAVGFARRAIHIAVVDEYHEHSSRRLLDALATLHPPEAVATEAPRARGKYRRRDQTAED